MVRRQQEIEAFVRRIIAEIEAVKAAGTTGARAIADHLNAKGVTSRRGRHWTGATIAKFLRQPRCQALRAGRARQGGCLEALAPDLVGRAPWENRISDLGSRRLVVIGENIHAPRGLPRSARR